MASKILSSDSPMLRPLRILVLGSGIIGLSSAVAVQEFFSSSLPSRPSGDGVFDFTQYLHQCVHTLVSAEGKDKWDSAQIDRLVHRLQVEVTIVSEHQPPNTTGDVAAGLWSPISVPEDKPHVVKLVNKWGKATWDFWSQVQKTELQEHLGVFYFPTYKLYDEPDHDLPFYKDIPLYTRKVSKEEISSVFPECPAQSGTFYISQALDTTLFNKWLLDRFRANGGQEISQKLHSLDELGKLLASSQFDAVLNCTGLGSHHLFGDKTTYPQRGQVHKLEAPWARICVFYKDLYIIPNLHNLVLGGTFQNNDWNLSESAEDRERIYKDGYKMMPSLKKAKELRVGVGLRPCREDGVRVEFEQLKIGETSAKVFHNYGHGGSGFTLFWGCALDLLGEMLRNL